MQTDRQARVENPQGSANAGQPSTLNGRVSRVAAVRTSSVNEPKATVISPILGAVIGVAGVIRQSRCFQIFEESRASTAPHALRVQVIDGGNQPALFHQHQHVPPEFVAAIEITREQSRNF